MRVLMIAAAATLLMLPAVAPVGLRRRRHALSGQLRSHVPPMTFRRRKKAATEAREKADEKDRKKMKKEKVEYMRAVPVQ